MATLKRIYKVTVLQGDLDGTTLVQHLVNAPNPAQAVRHVAGKMITAMVASGHDIAALVAKGHAVQEAVVETVAAEPPEFLKKK